MEKKDSGKKPVKTKVSKNKTKDGKPLTAAQKKTREKNLKYRKSKAKPLEEKAIQTIKGVMGRPTKFTPDVVSKILAAIRGGNYIETAAAWAGVSKSTVHDWLKQGATQEKGKFKDFSESVGEALAHAEITDVNYVSDAAKKGDWRASAWRLERRNASRWGRQETPQQITVETNKEGSTKVTLNELYKQMGEDDNTENI